MWPNNTTSIIANAVGGEKIMVDLSNERLVQRREKNRLAKAKSRKDPIWRAKERSRVELSRRQLSESDLAIRREKNSVARAKARQDPDRRAMEKMNHELRKKEKAAALEANRNSREEYLKKIQRIKNLLSSCSL